MTEALFRSVNLSGTDNPPQGICPACLQQSMEHISSGTLAVYCSHNRVGGWRLPGLAWEMRNDADYQTFDADLKILFLEIDFQQNGGDQRTDANVH